MGDLLYAIANNLEAFFGPCLADFVQNGDLWVSARLGAGFEKKRDFPEKNRIFENSGYQEGQKAFPARRLGHRTSASLMRVTVSSCHAFKASCLEW